MKTKQKFKVEYSNHKWSKFLRRSLMIIIIKAFQTIVFIFIVISMFRLICKKKKKKRKI